MKSVGPMGLTNHIDPEQNVVTTEESYRATAVDAAAAATGPHAANPHSPLNFSLLLCAIFDHPFFLGILIYLILFSLIMHFLKLIFGYIITVLL